jgi:hypothetical protein
MDTFPTPVAKSARIAMLWRGAPADPPTPGERLAPIARALEALGAEVAPIIWSESLARSVLERLTSCDGVLVWVDPLSDGQDRLQLDDVLRAAADRGVWVSGHPDVILKMGVKEVLVRTRKLDWGSDAHCYETGAALRQGLSRTLAEDRVRVIKQNRGNGSQGVWKVQLAGPALEVEVVEARGDLVERMPLEVFIGRCEAHLAGPGRIIDQAFQPRVGEGLVRCYMSGAEVVGFSEQFPRSRTLADPSAPTFGMAREKTMHRPDAPQFQRLRRSMQTDWTPGLQRLLQIGADDLPALWDADFLYGPKAADGEDSHVLCEINCSCVTPFPPSAIEPVAQRAVLAVADRRAERAV